MYNNSSSLVNNEENDCLHLSSGPVSLIFFFIYIPSSCSLRYVTPSWLWALPKRCNLANCAANLYSGGTAIPDLIGPLVPNGGGKGGGGMLDVAGDTTFAPPVNCPCLPVSFRLLSDGCLKLFKLQFLIIDGKFTKFLDEDLNYRKSSKKLVLHEESSFCQPSKYFQNTPVTCSLLLLQCNLYWKYHQITAT